MAQLKFLLFSAACYYTLQICTCEPQPSLSLFLNKPNGASFNRSLSFSNSPSTTITEKSFSTQPSFRPNFSFLSSRPSFKSEPETPITEPNPSSDITDEPSPLPSRKKFERKSSKLEELDSTNDDKPKKEKTHAKKNNGDSLVIKSRKMLKKRAADLFLNLIKDPNANRFVTLFGTNCRKIMQSKIGSNIILRHTKLITGSLMNEEAEGIIKDVRLRFTQSFIDPESPETTNAIFKLGLEYLSDKNLPASYNSIASFVNSIMNSKVIRIAVEKIKDAFFDAVAQENYKENIADMVVLFNNAIRWI